jgi:hypothetical protein
LYAKREREVAADLPTKFEGGEAGLEVLVHRPGQERLVAAVEQRASDGAAGFVAAGSQS